VIKPRCPDPELLALLIENRIGRVARGRILRHAADCVGCRRQLAIASLSPVGPFRAALARHLGSGLGAAAAGLLLGALALWTLTSGGDDPRPARPEVRSPRPRRATAAPLLSRARGFNPGPSAPSDAEPAAPQEEAESPASPEREELRPADGPDPAPPSPVDLTPVSPPHRLDFVAEGPRPPLPEPKAVESEAVGRLAILDPFGGLALEGAGGRSQVLGSRVVPVEARLTAVGKASGFRLRDGIRVQLSPGSAVSVFQNLTRRCAGLAVLQGALLVESAQPQSLFLRRDASEGVLEGVSGPTLLNAGPKADSLSISPVGSAAVVWRKNGQAPLEIAAGETLGVEAAGQELGGKAAKSRPPLSRFVNWPEPSSLFYSSFEDGVQGMERPVVVQGAAKEGYVAAAPALKGRKTIELTLPPSVQGLPPDATIRLRVRTTASRIQCSLGSNAARAVPVTVAQRNRSETAWTTVSIALAAFDPDGHRGRRGFRGNLTFTAEGASRISADDLVFDLDEIEINRS